MPKVKLREEMRAKLAAQAAAGREEKSLRIEAKLFSLPVFRRARLAAFFASLPEEVHTHAMIRRALKGGLRVALPRVDRAKKEISFFEIKDFLRDTRPGTLGVPEPAGTHPVDPAAFDCVVVPGLAFDSNGFRLGRGAGFYDKFLNRLSPGTAKIGIGFSFQMLKAVPHDVHDEKLDLILTD